MAKTKVEEKVNKSKLVTEAIEALGGDPGPKAIMEYVKQHHNQDLDYGLVASYKSSYKSKKVGAAGRRGVGVGGQVEMKDLAAVKDLLDRVGEARIQDMIRMIKSLRK